MSPLQTLLDAGLTLRTDGDRLIVAPSSLLDDALRDLIRAHKAELLAAARDAETVGADLIAAIRDCCQYRGDPPSNIEGLIRESADLSAKHQQDMLEHFANEAAIWRAATGAAS